MDGRGKTEDGGRRAEGGGRKTEDGHQIRQYRIKMLFDNIAESR